jgi:hypothetical protein
MPRQPLLGSEHGLICTLPPANVSVVHVPSAISDICRLRHLHSVVLFILFIMIS